MAAPADGSDDYEVIYTDSPLYWSMIDAGFKEIGEKDVHKIEDKHISSKPHSANYFKISWWPGFSGWLSDVFSKGFTWKVRQMRDMQDSVFTLVSNSQLLTEEDALFLQNLKTEQQCRPERMPFFLSRKALAVLAVITLAVFTFSQLSCSQLRPWLRLTLNTILVILLPVLLILVSALLQDIRIRRKTTLFCVTVENVLIAATKAMSVTAKSIRFIQECELVARGFTFVSNTDSSRVLKELQSTSKQRQQPVLRKKLFCSLKEIFLTFREAFSQLTFVCPVSVDLTGVTHYCSEVPLTQYPQVLQLSTANSDTIAKLSNITDGFSVDVLKSMQELNHIHVSEFVRHLAVSIAVKEKDRQSDLSHSLGSVLCTITTTLEILHKDLQSHLTACRHVSLSSEHHLKTGHWQPAHSVSQLQQVYTAVHSLELHLLAALKKIQDVVRAIEERRDGDIKPSSTGDSFQTLEEDEIEDTCREAWNRMLLLVKSEMDACSGCLEESVKRLQKQKKSETLVEGSLGQQLITRERANVNLIKVSAQDNPVILDEVFEAYSEPKALVEHQKHLESAFAQEEVWQQKQKRDLRLCLQELQSIIDRRAAEREERERIAVDRMKSGSDPSLRIQGSEDLDKLSANETSVAALTDCVDTLVKDMESRVEFWKQFDQEEHLLEDAEGKGNKSDNDSISNYNDSENSMCIVKVRQRETENTGDQVSTSASEESGFMHISDQDNKDNNIRSVSDGEAEEIDTPDLIEEPPIEENSLAEGNTETKLVEQLPSQAFCSPFAFSIASMVASRAKTFTQVEDTFGDSSSSENGVSDNEDES